ncbi:hypothetical protein [Nocardiopsis rhodophaea]|uniref:hypothetical protein n=1 Tax=Nocardiopsis rhodophaea TaxID=280238 RepID=UPI0031DC4DF4
MPQIPDPGNIDRQLREIDRRLFEATKGRLAVHDAHRIVAALRAVLTQHPQGAAGHCEACYDPRDADLYDLTWPCPTARAITDQFADTRNTNRVPAVG